MKEVKVDSYPLCDVCPNHQPKEARYDGKTKDGPWGYMCEAHFRSHGVGLGLGKGQKLILTKDGIRSN